MIPPELEGILVCSADTLSGAIRFAGTRVPVQALLDTIRSGDSIEDFMDGYPGVTFEQAQTVLHWEDAQARKALGLEARAL